MNIKRWLLLILVAFFLVGLSGFLTRQNEVVELPSYMSPSGGGGGVSFVNERYGFPFNVIVHQAGSLDTQLDDVKIVLNVLFWFAIVYCSDYVYRRMRKHENSRD